MRFGAVIRDWRFLAFLVAIFLGFAWAKGGDTGLAGMAIGLAGVSFNVWALWGMVRYIGRTFANERTTKLGTFVIMLLFFMKLPILIGLVLVTRRLGGAAPSCFLGGLALVYSTLIGWAVVER